MKLVNILGPFAELNKLIAVCIDSGCFHLENSYNAASGYTGFTSINEENPFGSKLRKMLDVLDYCGLEPALSSDKAKELHDEEIDCVLCSLEDSLHELQTDREEFYKQIEFYEKTISDLTHFIGLGFDLNAARNSEFVSIKFGKIPFEGYEKLKEYAAGNPYIVFSPYSKDETSYYGVYMTPLEHEEEVSKVFASIFFEQMVFPEGYGTPEEMIEEYETKLADAKVKLKKTEDTIDWYFNKHGDDFLQLYTQIKRDYDIFEYRHYATKYKKKFVMIIGWVPSSKFDNFEPLVKEIGGFSVLEVSHELKEKEGAEKQSVYEMTPPTKLKNNRLVRPFQFFVDVYGVPGYKELDPTAFLAITYTLLYGIMFADLGQGLVISLIGYWMYKYKNMPLGKPLIPCGIAGSIFGFIFGSVFGFEDVLDPVYHAIGLSGKPVDVLSSAIYLLGLAGGIGIFLIIIAMIFGIIAFVKKGNIGMALFSPSGGAGLLLYTSLLSVAAISYLKLSIPLLPILILGVFIPLILIFLHQPLSSMVGGKGFKIESVGEFFIESFFETFEVLLSYFTNTLSFLRVGAFILIHVGMMMAFANLAELFGGGIPGAIMIIFGNVFVIALEGLLVGIQVLRLEFYEMFSRFYEGNGHPFAPIKIKAQP